MPEYNEVSKVEATPVACVIILHLAERFLAFYLATHRLDGSG
jgi:hypothetical protein